MEGNDVNLATLLEMTRGVLAEQREARQILVRMTEQLDRIERMLEAGLAVAAKPSPQGDLENSV